MRSSDDIRSVYSKIRKRYDYLKDSEFADMVGINRSVVSLMKTDSRSLSTNSIFKLVNYARDSEKKILLESYNYDCGNRIVSDKSLINLRIYHLLRTRNLNDFELAEVMGIEHQRLLMFVSNELRPTIHDLKVIAGYFGVSFCYLLHGRNCKHLRGDKRNEK